MNYINELINRNTSSISSSQENAIDYVEYKVKDDFIEIEKVMPLLEFYKSSENLGSLSTFLDYFKQSYKISPSLFFIQDNSNKVNASIELEDLSETTNNYLEKTKEELIKIEVDKISNQYEKKIYEILCADRFEVGEKSNIDDFLYSLPNESLCYIKPALLRILSRNENNNHIIEGILRIFSFFEYKDMKPEGPTACLALFSHKSVLIKNKAIQVFEKWNSRDSLIQLENHVCSPSWIQAHLQNVISYIKEYGK